jgi:hypothetical protein
MKSLRAAAPLSLFGSLLLATSCSSRQTAGGVEDRPRVEGISREKGAVVLTGTALLDGPGSVLAAMAGKVPNLRVRHPAQQQCPEITLRGQTSIQGISNPHVYVDGTRTTDTCILETLRTNDVERVEVYPQGFTTRPGYATHAPGLILVFMRSS